jgi:hypothetical protein
LIKVKPDTGFDEDADALTPNKLYTVEDPPFEFAGHWVVGVVNDEGRMAAYVLERFTQAKQASDVGKEEYDDIMKAEGAYADATGDT